VVCTDKYRWGVPVREYLTLSRRRESMFCPKCGNAEQFPETYCRRCGTFLPDLDKPVKQPVKPETHVTANMVLSSMTIVACFTLAILLYTFVAFRENTHPLIYVTAGLLLAMGAWHVQTLWRSILLRKHFKRARSPREESKEIEESTASNLLEQADFENMVPASVTERTTRQLYPSKKTSSKSEQ